MLSLLSQISICALLAGLLGLYIGYLLAQESCKDLDIIDEIHH